MLIVLEGCDGSGKTTLAKMLATLFDASIVHCTTKTPNDYEYFRRIIESSKTKNIIADRFAMGSLYTKRRKKESWICLCCIS